MGNGYKVFGNPSTILNFWGISEYFVSVSQYLELNGFLFYLINFLIEFLKKTGNSSKIIFDPFPCWVVSVLRSFHVTNLFLSDQYIFATCWQIKGDKFYCLGFKYKGIRKSEFMADFLIDSKVQTWNMENSFFTLLQTCIKELYAGFTTISFNMINGSK